MQWVRLHDTYQMICNEVVTNLDQAHTFSTVSVSYAFKLNICWTILHVDIPVTLHNAVRDRCGIGVHEVHLDYFPIPPLIVA